MILFALRVGMMNYPQVSLADDGGRPCKTDSDCSGWCTFITYGKCTNNFCECIILAHPGIN